MSAARKRRSAADPPPQEEQEVPAPAAPAPTASKRKIVAIAPDADEVLAKCRQLRDELRHAPPEPEEHIIPDGVPSNIVEVAELPPTHVLEGMEKVALEIAHQVFNKKGFDLEIPSRASTNQLYIKEWDRIVIGPKKLSRSFLSVKEGRKSAVTLRVLQLCHAVLVKQIHITKRDLFYTDVKLFVDQAESDGVLDDVATMIGCTRSNLNVVASDKGLVVGRVQFVEDGDPIDCTRMGVGGKAIPPYIDKITDITSDAEFVLLVEKEAAYMRMAVSAILFGLSSIDAQNLTDRSLFTGRSILQPVSLHYYHCEGSA
jgi:meiotic recombination protein SPO11